MVNEFQYEQKIIFTASKKQKESSTLIVRVKIILYLYGTPRPLTSLHMSWQLKPFTPPDLKHQKIVFKDQERFVVFLEYRQLEGVLITIWIVWIHW